MNPTAFVLIVSAVLITAQQAYFVYERNLSYKRWMAETDKLHAYHREEQQRWVQERQNLLDRIQADSYREYKTQEIKMVKAQKSPSDAAELMQYELL